MTILVSGSLAYDRIMDFQGRFSDHILPEKIHVLNVSFTVNGLQEKFGGTAGNIAYGLSLLGEKPIILAAIGRDYHRYFDWLDKHKISREGIRIIEEELTAGAYITTDQADNQITGFNPGAMKYDCPLDIEKFSKKDTIAIVAPGNLKDMMSYSAAYKTKGISYIFDPGQSLPMWDKADLVRCIEGSLILISNDYELELISAKTGLDKKKLLKKTGAVITTLGEFGSRVTTQDEEIDIPAARLKDVIDPTGAGDAYRAGLLKGLAQGLDIKQCAEMGSACASFAVEAYGTQEHHFTMSAFNKRLAAIQRI